MAVRNQIDAKQKDVLLQHFRKGMNAVRKGMNAVNKSNEELRISVARETGLSVQSVNVS